MNRTFLLIIALYLPLVGCSTKVPRDSFHIIISSSPPEANVTICNESTGLCVSNVKTPFKMVLSRSQDLSWPTTYTVLCNKKGFGEVARTLVFGIDGWYLLIVDRATSEVLEVWEVDGHRIEMELPTSETIDIPLEDILAKTNIVW
jgi:hypothetical protein